MCVCVCVCVCAVASAFRSFTLLLASNVALKPHHAISPQGSVLPVSLSLTPSLPLPVIPPDSLDPISASRCDCHTVPTFLDWIGCALSHP